MAYAILRFQKKKKGSIAACERHNERKKSIYKSNPDIDIEKANLNYHLIAPPRYTYLKEVNKKIDAAGCKVRSDSIRMVETVITASPEFLDSLPPEEQREYFERALSFMESKIGKDNIISAIVHMDERTPHMHLTFVPLTKDNRLSAKEILGNKTKLCEWQTEYYDCMSERWPEIERGKSAAETHRKHIPTWLYKLGDRLDRECEQIFAELGDINMLNAGKKRDDVVELLREVIPEMNRFRVEVNQLTESMNYYKDELRGRENAYRNNRNELYEVKQEIYEDRARIRTLEHQLDKQNNLLRKIPPEILQEINRKNEDRVR